MSKASKLVIVTAVLGSLAVATVGQLLAAPVPSNIVAVKAAAPAARTDVRYRSHVARPYNYYSSDPYAYPPPYGDWGYSYWGSPTYSYWGYPSYYGYGYGW
jgi:hypothetical protein